MENNSKSILKRECNLFEMEGLLPLFLNLISTTENTYVVALLSTFCGQPI